MELIGGPASAMTKRAIGEAIRGNLILFHEFVTLDALVGGCLPAHVENFFTRADESVRLPMAFQAPFHV